MNNDGICKQDKNWVNKVNTNTRIMMRTRTGLEGEIGTNEHGTKLRAGMMRLVQIQEW